MKLRTWIGLGLSMALVISLAACSTGASGTTTAGSEETEQVQSSAAPEDSDTLSVSFTFQEAGGAAISDGTVQLSAGTEEAEYPTGTDGTLTVSGLPREGTVTMALLDSDGSELGSVELQLEEGSITDVGAQEDGVIRVTVIPETDAISLIVEVDGDGALNCALELAASA